MVVLRMRRKAWARPELSVCPFFVGDPCAWKGKWKQWFPQTAPLYLELGCGKGTFLAELAFRHPEVNFLGIDLSSDILGVARRNIQKRFEQESRSVTNVALTAYDIERILLMMDGQDVVDRLYINFCNPWPKGKHQKKRLTHTNQLEKYKTFLRPGAQLHFKTDDDGLFLSTQRYCREAGFMVVWKTGDLHKEPDSPQEAVTSEHEDRFTLLNIPIKALVAVYQPAADTKLFPK